ncbi:MAG: hypothetical protein IIA88_03535 [Bacteroidetes bacterium]|nr:hypothetical protein [Bacteroidota bacterium]
MKSHVINIFIAFTIIIFTSCKNNNNVNPSSSDIGSTGSGGSLARFAIIGNYLYTVDINNLKLFNITQPGNPQYEKSISVGTGIETIFPKDTILFIGSQRGMYIYDVSVQNDPIILSVYQHIYSCDPVVADDEYAYVTLRSENLTCGRNVDRLEIVDISDLSNPFLVKSYNMTNPKGLGIDNKELFICDEGLKVYNANDVKNLVQTNYFNIKANDVIPNAGNLMVIGDDGLYQYDYSGDSLKLLSKLDIIQ